MIVQSAKSAIQRYDPKVKAIMYWSQKGNGLAISSNYRQYDEFRATFRGTKLTGDSIYYNIAVNHALTTMKNQYWKGFSCTHIVDYDSITRRARKLDCNNGNSDPSTAAWRRGQS